MASGAISEETVPMNKLKWNLGQPKVVIMGNLAGGAFSMWKGLLKTGFRTHLMLSNAESGIAGLEAEGEEPPDKSLIWRCGGRPPSSGSLGARILSMLTNQFLLMLASFRLLRYDIIHSLAGALCQSPVWFFLFCILRLKPYLAFATGSDIREAPFQNGLRAWMARVYFRNAKKVLLLNIDMVAFYHKLGIKNASFFPFMIDTGKYSPAKVKKTIGTPDETLFFMPSHLDWGESDNKPDRTSTKGNDRFIRAFARCVKEGEKLKAAILYRGPDKALAKKLVESLGIADNVEFLPEMDKRSLISHFRMADVIVDQFDIGAYGTSMLEAMACGKPVLIFLAMDCARKSGIGEPPIACVSTEDEIYKAIKALLDPGHRNELGSASIEWIEKIHSIPVVAARLLEEYKAGRPS